MASLFVIQGNNQGSTYELPSDLLTIGRDASNAIQLHDQEVSRNHAELRREGDQIILRDLGSSNGTFVNRAKVQSQVLLSGDQVQLGRTLLLFTDPRADDAHWKKAVDIVAAEQPGESSRIVTTLSPDAGSKLLDLEATPETPWVLKARSNLEVVYRTALAVSRTVDIDQLLQRIMKLIFESVEPDRGCIMLLDAETRQLVPKVQETRRSRPKPGDAGDRIGERMKISRTILDYVLEKREGVLTTNAQQDERWNPAASIVAQGVREAICVPLQGRYDVVGAIYIDIATSPQRMLEAGRAPARFTEEHLKMMVAIAHQAALAVEDTHYYSAMVQAERLAAMGQTIAVLSHHVKNILQGIRGGSFLIKDGLARHDEAMVQKGWEFVERNQERISDMVMDMLTFSKEREPDMAPNDLNQVISDVVELMQSRATAAGVELVWQADPALPTLVFDAEGLHRAVLNIVTNAIDACLEQPQRRVEVRTSFLPESKLARVAVRDSGIGIPAEDLKKLFQIFVSTKRGKGTGLGLAVSQKIVQEHGGRITVESAEGQGATFTIELPAILPGESDVAQEKGVGDTSGA